MRTVMKNKVFTRVMTVLLLTVMVIMAAYPSVAYAQVDEKEAAQETLKEEPKKPESGSMSPTPPKSWNAASRPATPRTER